MRPCSLNDFTGVKIQHIHDKLVWMNRAHSIVRKGRFRKVSEVERQDRLCAATQCAGNDMPIIGVRQLYGLNQRLIANDQSVSDVGIHQLTNTLQALLRNIASSRPDVAHPFIMDALGPSSAVEVRERQIHQETPQRRRIEDARVIDDRIVWPHSIPKPQILVEASEFF